MDQSRRGPYRLNLLKLVIGMAVVRPDRFESQVLSADDQAGSAKIPDAATLSSLERAPQIRPHTPPDPGRDSLKELRPMSRGSPRGLISKWRAQEIPNDHLGTLTGKEPGFCSTLPPGAAANEHNFAFQSHGR